MNIVHIEDLTVAYDTVPVLWDIDLNIEANGLVAIVGPNGAGKSTLMKTILGFIKPLSGTITLFDQPLAKVIDKIAYVPQYSAVNWDFPITVFDVVLMGQYQKMGLFKKSGPIEKENAIDALKQMELFSLKDRHISQLSGGQKQRVFIARALCQNADLLFMDEPLAGVDKKSEHIIMQKLKQLQQQNKTIICVHHDLNTLSEYFSHVVLINKYVVASGSVAKVFTTENISKTYNEVNYD